MSDCPPTKYHRGHKHLCLWRSLVLGDLTIPGAHFNMFCRPPETGGFPSDVFPSNVFQNPTFPSGAQAWSWGIGRANDASQAGVTRRVFSRFVLCEAVSSGPWRFSGNPSWGSSFAQRMRKCLLPSSRPCAASSLFADLALLAGKDATATCHF